jgi:hypothetical protein
LKYLNIFLTVVWFVIAFVWIAFVAQNFKHEGWEWFFRLPIGITILFLGINTVLLKGRIDEDFRTKINNRLILFLLGSGALYLASLATLSFTSGKIVLAAVFCLFTYGISNAFLDFWDRGIGTGKRLETIATWCYQEFKAKQPWVMEKANPDCFQCFVPKRSVTENDIYAGKINKKIIHEIKDKDLLALSDIDEKELEIINVFLYVPRLPGISMDIARQIHKNGLYSKMAVSTLTLEEWKQYKGIGPKKGQDILQYLNSQNMDL